jgi:hypothetical protein
MQIGYNWTVSDGFSKEGSNGGHVNSELAGKGNNKLIPLFHPGATREKKKKLLHGRLYFGVSADDYERANFPAPAGPRSQ